MQASRPQIIEMLPEHGVVRQLFVLLHGGDASASSMLPLAVTLRQHFPDAAILLPEGFEEANTGQARRWFRTDDIDLKHADDPKLPGRVAEKLPHLAALVKGAQERFGVKGSESAIAGFSHGAVMALELASLHDGLAGRVLAFSGRYTTLPEKPPEFTTLHLFHGEADPVLPVALINEAYAHLAGQQADATLDVASGVVHELHPALIDRGVHRLHTCIPLRTWKKAL